MTAMTPDKVEAALGEMREVGQHQEVFGDRIHEWAAVITSALAERERDAARYRWLRDSQQTATHSSWLGVYPADSRCCYFGSSLDRAIDAAMKDTDHDR